MLPGFPGSIFPRANTVLNRNVYAHPPPHKEHVRPANHFCSRRTGVLTGTVTPEKHTGSGRTGKIETCNYFRGNVIVYTENAKESMDKLLEVRNELTQQGA